MWFDIDGIASPWCWLTYSPVTQAVGRLLWERVSLGREGLLLLLLIISPACHWEEGHLWLKHLCLYTNEWKNEYSIQWMLMWAKAKWRYTPCGKGTEKHQGKTSHTWSSGSNQSGSLSFSSFPLSNTWCITEDSLSLCLSCAHTHTHTPKLVISWLVTFWK